MFSPARAAALALQPRFLIASRAARLPWGSRRCGSTAKILNGQSLLPPIPSLDRPVDKELVEWFRQVHWTPEKPLLMLKSHDLPAMSNWFESVPGSDTNTERHISVFSPEITNHMQVSMPYELIVSTPETEKVLGEFYNWLDKSTDPVNKILAAYAQHFIQTIQREPTSSFHSLQAPLGLLAKAAQFNIGRADGSPVLSQLYIAQSNLDDLPADLLQHVPVPRIVQESGKGDIYNSSVWLGLQPTYTPFHRDPNPNLFCQLVGSKVVRVLPPEMGRSVYSRVNRQLNSSGDFRFRGTEMMAGAERELLHRAIWGEASLVENPRLQEALVNPGDSLFIPKGWWHSIQSPGEEGNKGKLNASVNWWFR